MYEEPTCLVAVLGDGTRFINGQKKLKNTSYQVRDLSKLKWAPGCKGEENKHNKEHAELTRRSRITRSRQQSLGFSDDDIEFAREMDRKSGLNGDGDDFDLDDANVKELTIEELLESMSSFDGFSSTNKYRRNGSFLKSSGSPSDPRGRKLMYNQLSEQEKALLSKWLTAIRSMILSHEELQKLKYLEAMEDFCTQIFDNMKSPFTKFTHCIVGPRYSGKSTFLAVLVSKIGERLATNGQWRRNFLFYISFRSVANNLDNLVGIFQSFVNATFQQAELQIPNFEPYAKKAAEFFCKVATNEISTIFPKRYAIDKAFHYADIRMTKLAEKVKKLFSDVTKFKETIDFTFNFPKEVAKIFEIPEVHYILDDFEECDIDLFDACSSKKQDAQIMLIERFKRLLPTVSYVLCCQNLPHFLSILNSIDKESIDIKTKVQIINIADLPINPPESHYEVLVEYKDGHTQKRVNRDHCQGCIGLIVGWDRLVKLGQIVENNHMLQSKIHLKKQKTVVFTEDDVRVIDYAKEFLPKLYIHDELPASKIFNVSLVDPKRAI